MFVFTQPLLQGKDMAQSQFLKWSKADKKSEFPFS